MCMTRECIRGAGIESLERRGRAGVTNQLWESRLQKTHPVFSPQREGRGTDKTSLCRPKPLQMITKNIIGWGRWGEMLLHTLSQISFFPPALPRSSLFIPAVTNATGESAEDLGLPLWPMCSSLHWWIARRLKANVNLVNTANTQKIPLSTRAVCRQDNMGWSLLSQRMFYWLTIHCPGCPRTAVRLTAKCSPVTHLKTDWPDLDIWNKADVIMDRAGKRKGG